MRNTDLTEWSEKTSHFCNVNKRELIYKHVSTDTYNINIYLNVECLVSEEDIIFLFVGDRRKWYDRTNRLEIGTEYD